MATRRNRNKELSVAQHLHAHDDDLDDGALKFAELHRDVRTVLGTVILVLVAVIGTGIWSNL